MMDHSARYSGPVASTQRVDDDGALFIRRQRISRAPRVELYQL